MHEYLYIVHTYTHTACMHNELPYTFIGTSFAMCVVYVANIRSRQCKLKSEMMDEMSLSDLRSAITCTIEWKDRHMPCTDLYLC